MNLSADELVTITVEPRTGFASGAPAYGSSSAISGAVRRRDELVRTGGGEDVMANLTVWLDASESPIPSEGDRITVDSVAYIVLTEDRVPELGSTSLSHVRLMAREA